MIHSTVGADKIVCYDRFAELFGGNQVMDRVRQQQLPSVGPTLDYLDEAFTSENWIVSLSPSFASRFHFFFAMLMASPRYGSMRLRRKTHWAAIIKLRTRLRRGRSAERVSLQRDDVLLCNRYR